MSKHQKKIVVIGASGAIGSALCRNYANLSYQVYALSRNNPNHLSNWHSIDIEDENSIKKAAKVMVAHSPLQKLIVATGVLYMQGILPEKSFSEVSSKPMHKIYALNTIGPALVMKHFLPLMDQVNPSIFAILSDRVGSISDNQLGGWHSYRASKAALNMLIRNASIEMRETHKKLTIVGLHPGTVESKMSAPYKDYLPKNEVFSPEFASCQLIEVLNTLKPDNSGGIFSWNGEDIPY